MKHYLKFGVVFLLLIMGQSFQAQTKKKVTTKPKTEKVATGFIEKIFEGNLENATLLLDEEFSKMNIVFNKVDDEKDFLYNAELQKTDSINHYFKHLTTDEQRFTILGNKNKDLLGFTLRDYEDTDSLSQKTFKKLGIEKWTLIEKKGNRILYQNENLFAKITSGPTKIYEIFKPKKLQSPIHLDSLTVRNSFTETIDFAQEMLAKNGFNLLAAKANGVNNDGEYNFRGYHQELIYDKGTEVLVEMDYKKKNTITITNPNAVIFSSLKNLLLDDKWVERYTDNQSQIKYFRKDNMMATFSLVANEIVFYPVPAINDNQTKLTYGNFLYLYELENLYKSFSFEDRVAYMTDHFVASNTYSNPSFMTQKEGATIRYIFYDDKAFADNWGLKYAIDNDKPEVADQYYRNMADRFEGLVFSDYNLDVAKDVLSKRVYFYDKAINQANAASYEAKKNAQLLANQRAEAEQKQRDIEREQEKARKNAELSQTINTATTELLKLLQK